MEQGSGARPAQPVASSPVLHPVEFEKLGFSKQIIIVALVIAVVAGGLTGYLLSGKSGVGLSGQTTSAVGGSSAKSGAKTAGVKDEKASPDCAKGQLEQGGLNGEGTHHLVREGGPSQTAYLLSSVVDLDQFAGRMVEVCGKSIASRRVAWLMDVGYVNVVE